MTQSINNISPHLEHQENILLLLMYSSCIKLCNLNDLFFKTPLNVHHEPLDGVVLLVQGLVDVVQLAGTDQLNFWLDIVLNVKYHCNE